MISAPAVTAMERLGSGVFTGALLRSYLEHEAEPARVLCALHRTLLPGGVAVVKVPNFRQPQSSSHGQPVVRHTPAGPCERLHPGKPATDGGRGGLRHRGLAASVAPDGRQHDRGSHAAVGPSRREADRSGCRGLRAQPPSHPSCRHGDSCAGAQRRRRPAGPANQRSAWPCVSEPARACPFTTEDPHQVPKARSPASPSPGRM